ncbi:MAG: MATE family efflux transporter [Prolixibacteraceae bacterium]
MQQTKAEMEFLPLYRRNLNMAFPVILSQIGQVTVALADTMMVGHSGTTDLAAASFSNSIFHVGMLFGFGIAMGITPLVGKTYSQQKFDEVGSLLKNGLFLHSLAALCLVIIMGGVGLFLGQMGQPPEVTRKSVPYFMLLVSSLLPLLVFFSFKQFLEGAGNTKIAMVITLTANLINIILNYIFIFGKFGFPAMGLLGAGLATLFSRILMPVMLIPVILKNRKYQQIFVMARRARIKVCMLRRILAVGLPIGFQLIVEVLTFSIGAVMMGWLGKESLAAHQVALGLASFTYMISLGVGAAATIHVSHEMGTRNYPLIRKIIYASLHLVVLFMSLMGLLFIVLRNYLPYLFTDDTGVIRIAAGLLVVAALFQVFDGVQVILLAALRGLADVKVPMWMAFFSYTLVGLPVCYGCAFVLNFGAWGIWAGFLAGLAVAAFLFGLRLKKIIRLQSV